MSNASDLVENQLIQDGAAWHRGVDAGLGQSKFSFPVGDPPGAATNGVRRGRKRWAPLAVATAVVCCILAVTVIAWVATHDAPGYRGHQPDAAVALPSAPASLDPLRPSHEADLPAASTAVTVSTTALRSAISMPWRLASAPSGRSLDVFYAAGDGGCTVPVGVHVVETTTTVELWVLSNRTVSNGACASTFVVGRSTIELSKPLGTRALLHPPSDPEWTKAFNATFPPS